MAEMNGGLGWRTVKDEAFSNRCCWMQTSVKVSQVKVDQWWRDVEDELLKAMMFWMLTCLEGIRDGAVEMADYQRLIGANGIINSR